jgi:hypothetical protein
MPTIQEIRQQYPDYNDMSDEQLAGALHTKFYSDMPREQFNAKIGLVAQKTDPNIFQRIGQDYDKRQANQAEINQLRATGQQGTASAGLQTLGQGAGMASDIGAEILKTLLPEQAKKDFAGAGDYLAQTDIGKGAGMVKNYVADKYGAFAKENPIAARNIDALGNMVGALPVGGAAGAAGKAALDIPEAVTSTLKARKLAKEAAAAQSKAAVDKEIGSQGYRLSAEENVQFHPEDLKTLDRNLTDLAPPDHASRMIWDSSEAAKSARMLQDTIGTEPLTLNGALSHRNVLNSKIKVATRAGNDNEARQLLQVKDALDKTMMSSDTGTWQAANHSWAKAAAKQDLEDMVSRAEGRAIPANSLDTEINKFLDSRMGKLMPDNERALLQQVTANGVGAKLRKSVAGGLTAKVGTVVGAKVGGIPGAVTGHLIGHFGSEFAKDAAMMAKLNKLDRVYEAIDARQMKTLNTVKRKPPAPYGSDFSPGEK